MRDAAAGERRLLIRDLEQLATPSADAAVPLRGRALSEVEVLEEAYVLCSKGRIEAVGRMRELEPLDGEVVEVDGRSRCAIPGLVMLQRFAPWGKPEIGRASCRERVSRCV